MKVFANASLVAFGAILLTFSIVAALISVPDSLAGRDLFIVAAGVAGLLLGVPAMARLRAHSSQFLAGAALLTLAVPLLMFFAVAATIAPPDSLTGRDLLIIAVGLGGVAIAGMAVRELRSTSFQVHQAVA